jgi:hypothetical protein
MSQHDHDDNTLDPRLGGDRNKSREKGVSKTASNVKVKKSSSNLEASLASNQKSNAGGQNTIESDQDSDIEIIEEAPDSTHPLSKLPLIDQIKRINEEEWRNIPKIVKQTFRLLIDFSLEEKAMYDAFIKKTNSTLERYNNITTRKFKQTDDKLTALEKQFGDKLKTVESTINGSIKNIKEGLNRTITSFDLQIKEVTADNRVISERMRVVEADCLATKKQVHQSKEEVLENLNLTTNQLDSKITTRIDKIVNNNLKIPGIIEDPEQTNPDYTGKSATLRDFLLQNIADKKTTENVIFVSA